jgi:hypothetical protein
MIIEMTGTPMPNRLHHEMDVMKLEREKDSPEYWQQYDAELRLGIQDFLISPQMPRLEHGNLKSNSEQTKLNLQRLGFLIPEYIPAEFEPYIDDPHFLFALLPDGWEKTTIQHSHDWINIFDEKHSPRMMVNIRNSSVERFAFYILTPRYIIASGEAPINDHNTKVFCDVIDNGANYKSIHRTKSIPVPRVPTSFEFRNAVSECAKSAQQFLKEKFPEYKNPFSYWP